MMTKNIIIVVLLLLVGVLTGSMDKICVPVIKKILAHYLELNPNYNNIDK